MITLTPSYGSMLGGTGVVVTGDDLVVNQGDPIVCLFDEIEVRGVYINSRKVLCVSPLLARTGKVQFMLNVSGSNSGESVFTSRKSSAEQQSYLLVSILWHTENTSKASITSIRGLLSCLRP